MPEETTGEPEPQGKGKSRLGLIIAIVLGALLGGVGGSLLLGPLAAEKLVAASGDGPAENREVPVESFSIENLVLNPAGTGGTRFLMTTIVARVEGEGALTILEEREAEVRDRLMELLGSKTVDELTDISHRDELKREILDALDGLGLEGIHAVFLPTFVIQ